LDKGDIDVALQTGATWRTQEQVPFDGRLLAVVGNGTFHSNWVVIDDEVELRATGVEPSHSQGALSSLSDSDLQTEVGQLLAQLRSVCNFDYAWDFQRLIRAARLKPADGNEGSNPDDDIDIESLGIRPRHIPRNVLGGSQEGFAELEATLASVPHLNQLHVVGGGGSPEGAGTGKPWKEEARLAVRLYNVLERWCQGISLPEAMYDEFQESRNFAGLVVVLARVKSEDRYLQLLGPDRVFRLVHILFSGFVGSAATPGFFLQLPKSLQGRIAGELEKRENDKVAGDLICRVLGKERPGLRGRILEIKPWLVPALEAGLVRGSDRQAEDTLLWAATWIDDALWAEESGRRYQVDLEVLRGPKTGFGAELRIRQLDLFDDPRAVAIVADYLRFSADESFIVVSGSADRQQRLRLDLGKKAAFKTTWIWEFADSDKELSRADIYEMAEAQLPWSGLFSSAPQDLVAKWRVRPAV
jgi:hypothetical protein